MVKKNIYFIMIGILMIIFSQALSFEEVFSKEPESIYYYNTEDEKNDFKEAYTFINKENVTSASKLINKWRGKGGYKVGWNILWAWVLMIQNKDSQALEVIESIRDNLEKNYKIVSNAETRKYSIESINGVKFLYYNMLFISGESNFELKNFNLALKDFLNILNKYKTNKTSHLFAKAFYLYRIAVCYYQLENYNESQNYLKKSYSITVNLKGKIPRKESITRIYESLNLTSFTYYQLGNKRKALEYMKKAYSAIETEKNDIRMQRAAYNVGGFYALLNDIDNCIKWLKIPLKYNKSLWLGKIKKDKDLDEIRKNKKFQSFISKY